jgi:hypothetical protein
MVVESMYSIGIVNSITFCSSDIVFLGAKKVFPLVCLWLVAVPRGHVLACNFEVSLPTCGFEKPLASMILCPYLIARVDLFSADISSSLLLIHPAVLLTTVLTHPIQCTTYI